MVRVGVDGSFYDDWPPLGEYFFTCGAVDCWEKDDIQRTFKIFQGKECHHFSGGGPAAPRTLPHPGYGNPFPWIFQRLRCVQSMESAQLIGINLQRVGIDANAENFLLGGDAFRQIPFGFISQPGLFKQGRLTWPV